VVLVGAATVVLPRFPKWWLFMLPLLRADGDHGTTHEEGGLKMKNDSSVLSDHDRSSRGDDNAPRPTGNGAIMGMMGIFPRGLRKAGPGIDMEMGMM